MSSRSLEETDAYLRRHEMLYEKLASPFWLIVVVVRGRQLTGRRVFSSREEAATVPNSGDNYKVIARLHVKPKIRFGDYTVADVTNRTVRQ